jgi:tryptophan halogenase
MVRSAGEARIGSGAYPEDQVRTVGVIGGGSAGLLAALALARDARNLKVTLIESPKIPAIGVGESTTPALARFLHHRLRIDPATLFRAVRPTLKLGIDFHWGTGATSFPFPFEGEDVLDAWAYDGAPQRQSNGSAWMAAGKGPVVREEGEVISRLASTNHAYHLDNRALLAALRQWAAGRVQFASASIAEVERRADGSIERLRADDGRAFAYDLYVDCSGFRSLLLGGALEVPFLSYESSLCTDRAIHGVVRTGATGPPCTEARTMAAGWRWTIPLRGEDHLGYVYASSFLGDDDAERELRASAPGIEDLAVVRFRSGRHRDFLAHNVVALGNAYGFVEPLESTALHMLAFQIEALLDGWPFGPGREPARRLLNEEIGRAWDGVRSFLAIHYRFNGRLETPLWRWARAECDLLGNEAILEHFADCAPLSMRADRQLLERALFHAPGFGPFAYDCLLLGQGVPTRLLGPRRDRAAWEGVARAREELVARSLPHGEALEAHEALLRAPR